jgi:thioredoxin reductase
MDSKFEVIIIGGSYAGLSAALALGRSLRSVLILDTGTPCNRQTPAAHNLLTHDGRPPAEIRAMALKDLQKYPSVSFLDDKAISVTGHDGDFYVQTASNGAKGAAKLLFATGTRDLLPSLPGFAECWAITAVHCPYCHGYELRHLPTAILVNDDSALAFSQIVGNLTKDLAILTNGEASFDIEPLLARGVVVDQRKIAVFYHEEGNLEKVQFEDGGEIIVKALYHRPKGEQQCMIPESLGCETTETGHWEVDMFQATTQAGVFAAGDCTTLFRSLSTAISTGMTAGAVINKQLLV